MQFHSRSIYGCTQSDFSAPSDVRYTEWKSSFRTYSPPFKQLVLPELAGKVAYMQLLNDASEIFSRSLAVRLNTIRSIQSQAAWL
jgi:alpha-L-fucosidase